MKRLQIMIDEDLDAALERQARREKAAGGVSSATMEAPTRAEEWIPEIVRRLRPFDPLKITLFGSRGRGDARAKSDVDLLVVLPRVEDKRVAADALRGALRGVPVAIDVFPVGVDEIERDGDSVGSFLYPVLREGRVVYGVDDRDAETWLRYADEDLEAAERMVRGRGWAPRIACFHAEQAAEKALKAVLVAERIPLQFTHNLELLRDLIPEERRTRHVDADLARLSRWAVVARYPGAEPDASEDDAREAVDGARALVEAARADVQGR